jgi:NAD dependent epimerase/dehydratase family enzyme
MNGTGLEPVTNAEFTRVLGKVLHRPTFFTAPSIALRVAFGREKADMLLGSQRAFARVAERTGYRFSFPGLEAALASLL